ncbi:MAG: hypothetical protein K2O57_04870, partial [Acetatifactor sp.]|nr:hypothetical protein [Acetatifactor sp.]
MSAEKTKNKIKNNIKSSIYQGLCGAAGLVLCVVLAGCHKADRAITLPVGELIETAEQGAAAELMPGSENL